MNQTAPNKYIETFELEPNQNVKWGLILFGFIVQSYPSNHKTITKRHTYLYQKCLFSGIKKLINNIKLKS